MSAPAQVNTLRSTDFPAGLTDKASLDRLFQILNPVLQQLGTVTSSGTSLAQNIDGQAATFTFTTGPVSNQKFVPLLVRLKDGKKPQFVLARALNKATQSYTATWSPAWTALGTSPSGNQLRIDDLPGLQPSTLYQVDLFIFF